jgi:cell division protein FtsB
VEGDFMSTNLTKEAVVTELYGLRAGLSVVSQHYDKVKQLEAANEILKEEIEYKEKCIADDEKNARKCPYKLKMI